MTILKTDTVSGIGTEGNAVDFGDLPYDNQQCTGCSNGHGGL